MRLKPFLYGLIAAVSTAAMAATFSTFTPATGILKGSASSSTTTAATSADVVALFDGGSCGAAEALLGNGSCGATTPAGAALTKTDDTNVTLTLGGSPTTALLNASSLTLGWTGLLAPSRGGLGISTVTDDTVAVANGTLWQSKALADCDAATSAVTYDTTANAWGCNTIAGATFANPSASIGMTATNGVATTAMRSDAAPAINAAITPTWTGNHTFSNSQPRMFFNETDQALNLKAWEMRVTGSSFTIIVDDDGFNGLDTPLTITRNTTGATGITLGTGVLVGSGTTGGNQGAGTINATGYYVNGVLLDAGQEVVGTFTGTLTGITSGGSCNMKYRKVGTFVTLFIASGTCSATSNSTAMTMTGLPAAIQPALNVSDFSPACIDNSSGLLTGCLASINASSSTMTLSVAVSNATTRKLEFDGTGWASSNTKGLNTNWVIQYQTGN
jgi:hypothetical protein